jgi:hypothetical protein
MEEMSFHKENREPVRKRGLPNPQKVGFLMGVVAFFAPCVLFYFPSYRDSELSVIALMWTLLVRTTGWHIIVPNFLDFLDFIFHPLILLQDIQNIPPLMLPDVLFLSMIIISSGWYFIGIRILFAYQTMRYFQGKTTRKRLFIMGVLAEFPMAIVTFGEILRFVILTVMNPGGQFTLSLSIFSPIPIPCMLIFGMLLIRYFPAPGESDWDLEKETKKWLPETNPDSTKTQENKLTHSTNKFYE